MDLIKLRWAIETSWDADTSYLPQAWDPSNPSVGQCATTTVVLECYIGGQIMDGWVKENRHFFLMVKGWIVVDLTWQQFTPGSILTKVRPCTRAKMVENEWMETRCRILFDRVKSKL